MSEYVNQDMQLNAPLEEELENLNWSALQDEIMVEPWMQFNGYDWGRGIGGHEIYTQEVNSQNHTTNHHTSSPELYYHMQNSAPCIYSATPEPTLDEPRFICDFEGCKSKPFKRGGDLNRHQLGHSSQSLWSCPAEDCSRTGNNGFTRLDKLKDHIIAGHKRETHFICPSEGEHCRVAGQTLPRDLIAVHISSHVSYMDNRVMGILRKTTKFRDCPLLRCPFRIDVKREGTLDSLQRHFITEHSSRARVDNSILIGSRGYDAATGNVVCPICAYHFQYPGHLAFYRHLIDNHLDGLGLPEEAKININPYHSWVDYAACMVEIALNASTQVGEGIREHQRTILNLWPLFEAHPVFDEIRGHPFHY